MNKTDIAEGCWSLVWAVDLNSSGSQIEEIREELDLTVAGGSWLDSLGTGKCINFMST